MSMRTPRRISTGFTLIEVLIALTIVSVALAAIVRASSLTISNLGLLQQQSLAMLSAENRVAELRIAAGPMVPGTASTPCPQGGVRLVCRVETGAVADGLRNVTVDVYLAEENGQRLASLQTRLAEPR
ncbi:type II secretion system minor pseudopilin GspI [Variovorax sp.]|uniref:type II secretion system minor pseudopilin GspI n=1 Tax=Variovorax sp. TaxID=1871043 RepID=UPI003BAADEF0